MIQVDVSLIYQIINFVILIFILDFFLYKPLLAVMDKRRTMLEEGRGEIGRLDKAVREKMAAYEEKLKITRKEALERNKELAREGADQAKALLAAANQEILAMTQEYQGKLQKEVQAAREYLGDRSQTLSVEIAERVLGRSIQ